MARRKKAEQQPPPGGAKVLPVEFAPIASLKKHPRNYRTHPADQIAHLKQSITEHGFYKNIVIANDGTILAGHGAVEAANELGFTKVPVVRLPIGPEHPLALKVVAGDNEIEHLAEQDDRLLSELLKEINTADATGLLGTGFDEMMLANLVFVTRPASEIDGVNAAARWAGLPAYDAPVAPLKVVVQFRTMQDKLAFAKQLGLAFTEKTASTWWPAGDRADICSVRFEPPGNGVKDGAAK